MPFPTFILPDKDQAINSLQQTIQKLEQKAKDPKQIIKDQNQQVRDFNTRYTEECRKANAKLRMLPRLRKAVERGSKNLASTRAELRAIKRGRYTPVRKYHQLRNMQICTKDELDHDAAGGATEPESLQKEVGELKKKRDELQVTVEALHADAECRETKIAEMEKNMDNRKKVQMATLRHLGETSRKAIGKVRGERDAARKEFRELREKTDKLPYAVRKWYGI